MRNSIFLTWSWPLTSQVLPPSFWWSLLLTQLWIYPPCFTSTILHPMVFIAIFIWSVTSRGRISEWLWRCFLVFPKFNIQTSYPSWISNTKDNLILPLRLHKIILQRVIQSFLKWMKYFFYFYILLDFGVTLFPFFKMTFVKLPYTYDF